MSIYDFIDTNYISVSILEEMEEISEWLKIHDYLVVIDEELKAVGIVTLKDAHLHPRHLLVDCDFIKPAVSTQQSILEVFEMMQFHKTDFLPVMEKNVFIGVISLISITESIIHNNDLQFD